MKKGTLNFLGRKSQSLFDTNIKIKEMDNVELVLDASNIPESGTAKVRSRPTVKHHTSSSDIVQGFAVPTPKVPILPPFNGPKLNGSVNGDRMSNGSAISVPDLVEEEMFIPPPPSMAPPPPPSKFIPPPDFLGDLASLQPPAMAPPKPPSVAPSEEDEDLTFLKPPPMAPPKPPSTSSSASTSSLPISTPPPFAPPQPPTDRQQVTPHKALKGPPPKPMRLSSISTMDGPPQAPAPAPPVQIPTPSSFNPQNTAKLYNVPKTTILGVQINREKRPKQILLLQDSGSTDAVTVPAQVNGNFPSEGPPAKPARRNSSGNQLEKDLQELKENLQATLPGQPSKCQTQKEVKVEPPSLPVIDKPAPTPPIASPNLPMVSTATISSEASQVKLQDSPDQSKNYSPLLERKLRHLKSNEVTGTRDGAVTSPLALLMAAKERDKHRSSLSRENSTKKSDSSTASIQPSESRPNSFTVIPRSTSSSSLASPDRPNSVVPVDPTVMIQTPGPPQSTALVGEKQPPTNPVQGLLPTSRSSSSSLAVGKQSAEQGPSPSICVRDEENGEELCMALLPPPPEFANFDDQDDSVESPPSSPPPDPPQKKVLPPTPSSVLPVKAPTPTPPPKPKPPSPPKLLPPDIEVKPKLPVQNKPKAPPSQAPASLSASQATLLSILQKKMLEMDHKMVPMKETESSTDDWGTPLSEEETKFSISPRAVPKNKTSTLPVQTQSLDMRELENKVAKKAQDLSLSSKATTSNGPQSKQPFGMTFQVRPGTKQPITVVNKGDP